MIIFRAIFAVIVLIFGRTTLAAPVQTSRLQARCFGNSQARHFDDGRCEPGIPLQPTGRQPVPHSGWSGEAGLGGYPDNAAVVTKALGRSGYINYPAPGSSTGQAGPFNTIRTNTGQRPQDYNNWNGSRRNLNK